MSGHAQRQFHNDSSHEVGLLLLYDSLGLQDYNNKASDDEVATVQCLDIEA